jgi:Cd2+/Zn2+-exporting ATPase
MNKKQRKMLARILVTATMWAALTVLPIAGVQLPDPLRLALYLVAYLVIGHDGLRKAWRGILNRRVFDENFLMAVATIGALALAVYERSGDYGEAIAVMLFYQVGELFQSYAVGRSRRSISELMDIRPDYANVETDGTLERVDPDDVEVGSIIVVQPGEKVPIDGVVVDGTSSLDTAALTGESVPRDVAPGEEIVSGCINLAGLLRVRTTREFDESTASKILELVENSTSHKSRSENFISRFARVYTPAVCYSALALAVVPPVALALAGQAPQWASWVYRALTFLVISCPCALVVSIPLSFFAGIGASSHAGVLVKGSNYLEALSQAKTVVFDKTGTLTKGVFDVTGVHHSPLDDAELMELAALAECASSHPISKSLQRAYGAPVDRSRVANVREVSGRGVIAEVDGRVVAVGNEKLMRELGVAHTDCHSIGTIVHVALDGSYAGHIVISDAAKDHAAAAVQALRASGVERVVMLTGDSARVAEHVAASLGIDEVHAGLLPQGKVEHVEALLAEIGGAPAGRGKLAFVGDGINDAPVLARADIGIAMGAMGSDAAIEAADVVLMDDDPMSIAKAIKISRKCLRIVYENIAFSLLVKFACLALGAFGVANMWLAIFADVGVMVLAVLNAIRALRVPR